jgi:hypothetical protein
VRIIESTDEAINRKQVEKKVKQKLNYACKYWSENLNMYEEHEKTSANRKSYFKTENISLIFLPGSFSTLHCKSNIKVDLSFKL